MLMFRKPSRFIAVHRDKCSDWSFPTILGDTSCPSIGRVGWLVGWLVCWLVDWSADDLSRIILQKGRKLHFTAPIGALIP